MVVGKTNDFPGGEANGRGDCMTITVGESSLQKFKIFVRFDDDKPEQEQKT